MLVLSRKPGEIIRIGDDIVITYLGPNGKWFNQAAFGIEAPITISVHRGEIFEAIMRGEPHQKRYTGS